MLENKTFVSKINQLAVKKVPFLFIVDYLGQRPLIYPLDALPDNLRFEVPGRTDSDMTLNPPPLDFEKHPVAYADYKEKFDQVKVELSMGNTYLINLTVPTPIDISWSLEEVYARSQAPFKLLLKNQFVVFSPERFVRINGNRIETFPMKGTIDANLPGAAQQLLDDTKETAEHHTIVDLMRNDLSRFASQVTVERFRYLDRIKTHEKEILQASSAISGILPENYTAYLGELLLSMLPAGSITGAPKKRTIDILKRVEGYERGYYTGVFGLFDGTNLDSAVMIRYIEQTDSGYIFKSGGGITHLSQAQNEYQEIIDKVYVPLA